MISLLVALAISQNQPPPPGRNDPASAGAAPIHPIAFIKGGSGGSVIWRSVPSIDQLRDAYPKNGDGRGTVSMTCAVDAEQRLHPCSVDYAIPSKSGFEDAALGLAKLFEIAPEMMAMTHGAGRQLSVSLLFEKRGEEGLRIPNDRCIPTYCNFTSPPPPPPKW